MILGSSNADQIAKWTLNVIGNHFPNPKSKYLFNDDEILEISSLHLLT